MEIRLERSTLRPWRMNDGDSLVCHANNRKIWINLRDAFPHPYQAEDAAAWLAKMRVQDPVANFAIEVEGEAAGSIGVAAMTDVHCRCGEIGYWLAEKHWNRGIVTEAVNTMTDYAFEELALVRLQAGVFEWNAASMRVLEKCAYEREGVLRKSVIKDGRLIDSVLYARLKALRD